MIRSYLRTRFGKDIEVVTMYYQNETTKEASYLTYVKQDVSLKQEPTASHPSIVRAKWLSETSASKWDDTPRTAGLRHDVVCNVVRTFLGLEMQ